MTALGALDSSATIPDAGLASPNNSAYTPIRTTNMQVSTALGAATYVDTNVVSSGATAGRYAFYLDPAWFAAGSLTTKYQVHAALFTNATNPGTITYTAGLHPVSATAGGNDINTITISAATSGSTCAFTNPSASTRNHVESGDFTAPAAGYFVLCLVTSATEATNGRCSCNILLTYRNV